MIEFGTNKKSILNFEWISSQNRLMTIRTLKTSKMIFFIINRLDYISDFNISLTGLACILLTLMRIFIFWTEKSTVIIFTIQISIFHEAGFNIWNNQLGRICIAQRETYHESQKIFHNNNTWHICNDKVYRQSLNILMILVHDTKSKFLTFCLRKKILKITFFNYFDSCWKISYFVCFICRMKLIWRFWTYGRRYKNEY